MANIMEIHPSKFGNFITDILKKKNQPISMMDIVREIMKVHQMCELTIKGPVKKVLEKGVEDGFLYYRNRKYSLQPIKDMNGEDDEGGAGDTSDTSSVTSASSNSV